MNFESICHVTGTKTGKTNDGKQWYLIKLVDNTDKHINIFDSKQSFEMVKTGCDYIVSFSLYYDLKLKQYKLSGHIVNEYKRS